MANRRVTLEIDTSQLFDVLAKVGDGGEVLRPRLVSVMLADAGMIEQIGLGVYGITIEDQSNG